MNRKTNKTAHVLKLLAGVDAKFENPMINENFKKTNIIKNKPENFEKENTKANTDVGSSPIKNVIETVVNNNIDEIINRFGVCGCTKCRMSIYSTVLKEISPQYAIVGSAEEKIIEQQSKTQVIAAVVKAVLKIKTNPIH